MLRSTQRHIMPWADKGWKQLSNKLKEIDLLLLMNLQGRAN